jgi:hypothetical protein
VEQKTQFYVCHDCSGSVATGHKCVCKTQDQKSIRRLARDLSREQKTRQRRAPAKREEQIVAANSALQARLLAQDAERIRTQREAGKKSSEIAQGEVTLIGPNPSGDASRQNMRTFFMQRAVDRRARAEMLEVKAGRKKVITGRDGKYIMVDEFDAKGRQMMLDDAKKLRRKADEDEKAARRMPVRQEGETVVKRSLEGITLGYGLGAIAIAGFGAYLLYSMFQRDPRDDKRAA